jgi:hypothetical protein
MYNKLPIELINKIWSYDFTYNEHFNCVIDQIRFLKKCTFPIKKMIFFLNTDYTRHRLDTLFHREFIPNLPKNNNNEGFDFKLYQELDSTYGKKKKWYYEYCKINFSSHTNAVDIIHFMKKHDKDIIRLLKFHQ